MQASSSQLAQLRPSGTSATSAFTATLRTEITRVMVANTTGTAASFSLYHDDDGSTFDATTALYMTVSVPANSTTVIEAAHENTGITIAIGGQIGIQTSTSNALTFTLYGITENKYGRN